jgi:hypothetical protein
MSSPIIVEDGTGVTGANSYCTGDYIRSYASGGGITLPSDDNALLPLITGAMLYLELLEPRYKGQPSTFGQPFAWPRTRVFVRNVMLDSAIVPTRIIDAECQLIIEQFNGVVLHPTTLPAAQGGGFVTMEKIDVIQTNYSERIGTTDLPRIRSVQALLAPLMGTRSGVLELVRA